MRTFGSKLGFVAFLAVLTAAPSHAQDVVDGFVFRTFTSASGSMPYRLFVPDTGTRGSPLPVIVYLHGGGGAGKTNLGQITGGNTSGTHLWTEPQMQARHPAFVVAPQLPAKDSWGTPGSEVSPYAGLAIELLAS